MIKKNQLPNEYNDVLNARGAFFVIYIVFIHPWSTELNNVCACA